MTAHNYPKITVKVNQGSGCLFVTGSADYIYVLTARHVITGVDEIIVIRQYLDVNQTIINERLTTIGAPYLHPDPNKDAALIKVTLMNSVETVLRLSELIEGDETYTLVGHPDTRDGLDYSFRSNDLVLRNPKPYGYIEAELRPVADYTDIVGQSGGAIVKSEQDYIMLAGIQTRMSVDQEIEALGRIDFMPLTFFDEIIAVYPDELTPLLPAHLECFSHLKNLALKLEGCWLEENMTFTRKYLQDITDQIISNQLTPKFISDLFKGKLLVFNQQETVLSYQAIWIAWLEFLILMNIIKSDPVGQHNIEKVFDDYRLIYSSTTKDWATEIPNIIRSDFRGLAADAKVLVATNSIPHDALIPEGMIVDIVRRYPLTRQEMQIDTGIVHPLVNYKLIHIYALQKRIIDKEVEYGAFSVLTEEDLLNKLKQEFNALFD